ncbi:MAG: hypothetical protein V9G12_00285 [Microthrixaceae bacterium]
MARQFDLVVAAGNVMIFLQPGTEAVTVDRLAEHLRPGGVLVTGFQLTAGRYGVDRLDRDCAPAGLELIERFASWSRDPWMIGQRVRRLGAPAPGRSRTIPAADGEAYPAEAAASGGDDQAV